MEITPEEIQQAIALSRLDQSYTKQRDAILTDIGEAYKRMASAVSRYTALQNSVASGELLPLAQKHATMQTAMANQDAAIQAAFEANIATLLQAQAIVFEVTNSRFLPHVPMPEPPEEPES